ncbi:steroid receptor RNA activator 1 [Nymphalis io]|uniref:steroid receptor RNA activator 1 n=1 Tax=Inachis io TaxID=171585 RepID=UPI0021676975|nr:steroid receptor RNA activator 1 [Nymphalis io]
MDNCDSTLKDAKPSYAPGWNDPPSFAYNAQQTTPNRPRNFLNKRVAFPLSGGTNTSAPTPPVNMPPLPTNVLPPMPSLTAKRNVQENTEVDSEYVLKEVKDILLSFLDSSDDLAIAANIKKRIENMENMWLSGKLNTQIQVQMRDLAYALKDNDYSKADEIHKAIMVNHVSAVSMWMPGIKQVIALSFARSELLAFDYE